MKDTILLHGARQLLTLRGPAGPRRGAGLEEMGIIQDGALLIREGRIFAVGQGRRVENLAEARDAVEIDATRRVVLPGFVDSHTHLISGPPRLAGEGLSSSVTAVRAIPSQTLERQARLLIGKFLRHGTTTLEAKSGYGLDRTGEMKSLRVLAKLGHSCPDVIPTYFGAHAVPPEYTVRPHEYVDWMCEAMLPLIRRRKLARFVDVCCGREAFRIDDARRYLESARDLGFGLKIQAEQFSHSGGARLAVELGAISADHLVHADSADVALLARSSTIATLLPGPVFHLGLDRYAPAKDLIAQGAAVALATGYNPITSPTCNMQMVLSLACARMQMSPAQAIAAATINGACAIGCDDQVGSLESGKCADLTLFDVSDYREIPYHFGVNLVAMTMKRGKILYREQEVEWPGS